jgi:hypothetical protein
MEENFKMLAKTFYGFEEILEKEVRLLGGKNIQKGNRVVSFEGDLGFLYKANLSLRTALKILKAHPQRTSPKRRGIVSALLQFSMGRLSGGSFQICDRQCGKRYPVYAFAVRISKSQRRVGGSV